MAQQGKRLFSAFLAVVIALSVMVFIPTIASAAENKIMTVTEWQKQYPKLFTVVEYVPGYPIPTLVEGYTIPSGVTLKIEKGETLQFDEQGSIIISGGAELLVVGQIALGPIVEAGIIINKDGILRFEDSADGNIKNKYLNAVINNGTIIVGKNNAIMDYGAIRGNRPIGSFHLVDTSWQFSSNGKGALDCFEWFTPNSGGDYPYNVFANWGNSSYSALPIYWSVKETTTGFVYSAELIPEYDYDGMWIYDSKGNEIDYKKPIKINGGTLTFGVGDEWAVVKCTFDSVTKRDLVIDKLIVNQGERPVAGSTKTSTTTEPTIPQTPQTATPTASKVLVNGKEVAFDAYNINGNNYFKLRDLAYILNGTQKQFEVGWDGVNNAISLTKGKPYTSTGGEMAISTTKENKTANPTSSKIYLDGKEVSFTAYNIDGNNYFKLRDIMKTFNVFVGWEGSTNTITLDTSKGYVD